MLFVTILKGIILLWQCSTYVGPSRHRLTAFCCSMLRESVEGISDSAMQLGWVSRKPRLLQSDRIAAGCVVVVMRLKQTCCLVDRPDDLFGVVPLRATRRSEGRVGLGVANSRCIRGLRRRQALCFIVRRRRSRDELLIGIIDGSRAVRYLTDVQRYARRLSLA